MKYLLLNFLSIILLSSKVQLIAELVCWFLIPDTVNSTISPGPLYLQVSHVSLSHENESHKI